MSIKSYRTVTILIVTNLLLLFLFFISLNQKLTLNNFKDHKFQEKEYILEPIGNDYTANVKIDYPPVQTAPASILYWLVLLKEKIYIQKRQYDYLFFANKRIAELDKWGNVMLIKGQGFASWQTSLNRYKETIERYIQSNASSELKDARTMNNLFQLKFLLSIHQTKLEELVYQLPRTKVEKKYLISILGNTFKSLNQKLRQNLPFLPPNYLAYSLYEILKDKEYGSYHIYVNSNKINGTFFPDLLINNKIFNHPHFLLNEPNANFFHLGIVPTFQNIEINKDSDPLILVFSKNDLINVRSFDWPEVVMYKRSALSHRIPSATIAKLQNNQYLITNTNTTASQDDYIIASLEPGWKVMRRTDNDGVSKFVVIFWSTQAVFFCWLISLALLIFFLTHRSYPYQTNKIIQYLFFRLPRAVISAFKWLRRLLTQYFVKLKFIILLFALSGTIYYNFLYKPISDFIISSLIILWVASLIGYKATSRSYFNLALLFLIISPILLTSNNYSIVDKNMTWFCIFLIMGTVQSRLENTTRVGKLFK